MLGSIVTTLIVLGAAGGGADPTFAARGIKRVVVESLHGDVHVRATHAGAARVHAVRLTDDPSCVVRVEKKGKTLGVTVEGTAAQCHVDLDVFVPPEVDSEVRSGEGNVFVEGVGGKLALHLARGNAVLGGRFAVLEATLEHGSMSATGAFNHVRLHLGAGNAQLWYDTAPRKGSVELEVERGNVTLAVPQTQAEVHARLAAGQLQNGCEAADAGFLAVDGVIEAGNLVLRRSR